MDAIEFVNKYEGYIQEIESVIISSLSPVIEKLVNTDPHDLITPETWFPNETAARGYVWSLFLKEVKKQS